MTSTRPEYNNKITLMQSLAPVAFIGHMKSPLLTLIGTFNYDIEVLFATHFCKQFIFILLNFQKITKFLGLHEFLPNQSILSDAAKIFCKDNNLFNVCLNVIFAISGADPAEIDAVGIV
jgi:lysosomal acid lipase/cholesteryl ester hydrolase